MKKKDIVALRTLADILPITYYEVKVKKSGKELLASGVEFDGKGNLLEPNLIYEFTQKHPVNHARRIKDIYVKEGKQGVENYCAAIKLLDDESKMGLNDIVKQMEARKTCLI